MARQRGILTFLSTKSERNPGTMAILSVQEYSMESTDLYNWKQCTTPTLQPPVGEGPQVTTWNNFMWLNWEGGVLMRSADGGESWNEQPNLFTDLHHGSRYMDGGTAHQGP